VATRTQPPKDGGGKAKVARKKAAPGVKAPTEEPLAKPAAPPVVSVESDFDLEKFKASLKLLTPQDRRKQMQAMWARDPRLTNETVAGLFGVSERTVEDDRVLLKAEGSQRFANDPDLRADVFGPFEAMRDAALADCAAVDRDSPNRAAHRRTGLAAQEKMLDIMFRCGYIAEAPRKVNIGGQQDNPVKIEQSGRLVLTGEAADAVVAFHEAREVQADGSESAESPVE